MRPSGRGRSYASLTAAVSGFKGHLVLALSMLLLAKQAVSIAVPTNSSWAEELAKLPSCARSYLAESCPLSNISCICQIEAENHNTDRVLAACTLPEALYINNSTKTICQVAPRDQAEQFNIMVIILGTTSSLVVAIRLVYKQIYSARKRLETDDWVILSAVPIGLATIVLSITGLTAHGLGKDLWGVSQPHLRLFGTYFLVVQILYISLMAQLKLSLCFFYLSIFPGKIIRRLLWWTMGFHVAFSAAFTLAAIFQCTPISYNWDKFDGPLREGHCINVNAAGWANGAITVSSDFWLLAIPLSQVRVLKLHWKKKVGVTLMFLTGAIVTIVSFLRMRSIAQFASTVNPTWDLWGIVWWSSIEICVGFICTCLPTMRLVLLRIAPRAFGSFGSQHHIRLPARASKPRQPNPPLCSGYTLASIRSSHTQKMPSHLDRIYSPLSHRSQADCPDEYQLVGGEENNLSRPSVVE